MNTDTVGGEVTRYCILTREVRQTLEYYECSHNAADTDQGGPASRKPCEGYYVVISSNGEKPEWVERAYSTARNEVRQRTSNTYCKELPAA